MLQGDQPVAYASRSLNSAERNCAQIEKKMLAIFFGTSKFVVLVDYYSKYFELTQLKDRTSASVINCLKQHMSRHGIPEVLIQIMALNLAVWNFNGSPNSINFSMLLHHRDFLRAMA